jgi:hypothetical protein
MDDLNNTEITDRDRRLAIERAQLDAARVAAGLCRHCGGKLPCWSMFGDYLPGRSYDWGKALPLYGPKKGAR